MKKVITRLSAIGVFVGALALMVQVPVSAHVTVKPGEALTATYQTFTVSVPNEKSIPTTSVTLTIPEDITSVTPTVKRGWTVTTDKSGSGESQVVTSITWQGGDIPAGLRDEFTFSAKVPSTATELQWKAYQTYADGEVVSWDAEAENNHTSSDTKGPFSVTQVVSKTAEQVASEKAEKAATDAQSSATLATYIGAAGLVVGLVVLYLVTRKK